MLLHIRTTSGSVRIFLKRKAIFSFCVLIQLILMSNCLSTDQFMSILVYGIHGMIPYFLIWAISENSDNKHITTVHRLSKFCSYHCKPACFPFWSKHSLYKTLVYYKYYFSLMKKFHGHVHTYRNLPGGFPGKKIPQNTGLRAPSAVQLVEQSIQKYHTCTIW